jgi:hypothetical protein
VQLRDNLKQGMQIVEGRYGLPPLPKAEFLLIWGQGSQTPAAREFGQLLMSPGS